LYAPDTHRDLHSFPTRRSSDLVYVYVTSARRYFEACLTADVARWTLGGDWVVWDGKQRRVLYDSRLQEEAIDDDDKCDGVAYTQDRKSTRLNSSHVKISYAVFC